MREAPPEHLFRVLIVDDCKDNRETLGLLLGVWGYDVRLAADGPSALEAARADLPDAVLLDIGLPGMDGWEVGRQMRLLQGAAPLVLIAMTGCGREQDRARSREAGFDAHLTKPARLSELRVLLQKAADACTLVGAA